MGRRFKTGVDPFPGTLVSLLIFYEPMAGSQAHGLRTGAQVELEADVIALCLHKALDFCAKVGWIMRWTEA